MNRNDCRDLAIRLYYSATGKHDVDDHQWNLLLDTFNKKYWAQAAKGIGSLLQLDTPDLTANVAGGFDYSGSLYWKNDLPQPINFGNSTAWTNSFITLTSNAIIGPLGNYDGTMITASGGGGGSLTSTLPTTTPYPGGTLDVYFKQAAIPANPSFIFLGTSSGLLTGNVWFDTINATVGTVGITGASATCVPASYPGFPYQIGVTSSSTPTKSPTGWYRATVLLPTGATSANMIVGLSNADNATSTTAGQTSAYIWGARKTPIGSPIFASASSNMIDPNGVHAITAVELKYLGRYLHLDYEIPQDRYVYNIAFGQIQVLIPSAYTIMGEQILLLPKTTGSQILRISYIPRLVDWISDSIQALNGFMPEWHHIIPYEAAALMSSIAKPGNNDRSLAPIRDEIRQQWREFIQSRQRQDGRKIRFVPYE